MPAKWIKLAVLLLLAYHVVAAVTMCANRLSRPVLVDGMEDCMARFAYHMMKGENVYGPVDVHVERMMYTPLSVQINAWAMKIFGLDIRVVRVTSLLAALGCVLLLGLCIRKLTGDLFLSTVGAGLLLGVDVGIWYITPGPNNAHTFFALAGLFFLIRKPSLSWTDSLLATLCLFAGFWSKQTGLAYLAAGLVAMLFKDVKKGLGAAAAAAALAVIGIGYYAAQPGSNFLFNCFKWLTYDPLIWSRLLNPILFPELLGRFGVLAAFVLAGVFSLKPSLKNYAQPHFLLLGASTVTGPFAEMKYGSGNIQSLFFYAMIILCGLTFLRRFVEEKRMAENLALFFLVVQSAALIHSISLMYITDEDEQRFMKIQSILSAPGKTVYYYAHGYHNVLAGKPPYVNLSRNPGQDRSGQVSYPPVIADFWQGNPFDVIISFYPWEDNAALMLQQVQQYYTMIEDIPPSTKNPYSTELRKRLLVFGRKEDAPGPAAQPPMRWQPPK